MRHQPAFLPCCSVAPWEPEVAETRHPVRPEARHLSCPFLSCQAAEGASVMAPHGSHAVDQGPSLGILEQIQKDQAWPFPSMRCRLLPAPCTQLFLLPGVSCSLLCDSGSRWRGQDLLLRLLLVAAVAGASSGGDTVRAAAATLQGGLSLCYWASA